MSQNQTALSHEFQVALKPCRILSISNGHSFRIVSQMIPVVFLQVVKLARKYDPDGIRTLGVVTKCDDAANAEASDVVEKAFVLSGDTGCRMSRMDIDIDL